LGVLGFIITANLLGKPKNQKNDSGKIFGRKFAFIGGGLALILVLFGIVLLLGGDNALVRTLTLQSTTEDISNGRLHFWSIALQNFANYPILGSGLNSYGMIFPQYDTWSGILRVENTHNDYLQILSDAGIVGFSCVVGFIYLLFKKSLQLIGETEDIFRKSVAIGALAGCFGILIHSFFDFPLRTPSNSFFFLTMATLATVSVYYPKGHRRKH
jgi:O-antigen ligase